MESFTSCGQTMFYSKVWSMADGGVDHDYYDCTATTVYVVGSMIEWWLA